MDVRRVQPDRRERRAEPALSGQKMSSGKLGRAVQCRGNIHKGSEALIRRQYPERAVRD